MINQHTDSKIVVRHPGIFLPTSELSGPSAFEQFLDGNFSLAKLHTGSVVNGDLEVMPVALKGTSGKTAFETRIISVGLFATKSGIFTTDGDYPITIGEIPDEMCTSGATVEEIKRIGELSGDRLVVGRTPEMIKYLATHPKDNPNLGAETAELCSVQGALKDMGIVGLFWVPEQYEDALHSFVDPNFRGAQSEKYSVLPVVPAI